MWNHLLTHKVKERRLIGAKGSQERFSQTMGFPGGSAVKNSPANSGDMSLIPWRREWQPSPVFLPRKSHGQRRLVGDSMGDQSWSWIQLKPLSTHAVEKSCAHMLSHLSCVRLFVTPGIVATRLLCPWGSPGKNTGVGCHARLQGISPTQGLNPRPLQLLHRQAPCLPLSHRGSQ